MPNKMLCALLALPLLWAGAAIYSLAVLFDRMEEARRVQDDGGLFL